MNEKFATPAYNAITPAGWQASRQGNGRKHLACLNSHENVQHARGTRRTAHSSGVIMGAHFYREFFRSVMFNWM